MFKWSWTIYSLGAPEELKATEQTDHLQAPAREQL